MTYRLVEHPAFEAVGWAHRTSTVGGQNLLSIPRFWQACHAGGLVAPLAAQAGALGLVGLCAEVDPGTESFTYLVAVEKMAGRSYPAGTLTLAVPAATYAVFSSEGPLPGALQLVWKRVWSEWFPGSGQVHGGTPAFESYPLFPPGDERGDPTSSKYYVEVWIPVQKKD